MTAKNEKETTKNVTATSSNDSTFDINFSDIVNHKVKTNDERIEIKPKGNVVGLPKSIRLMGNPTRSFFKPTVIDPNTHREVQDKEHQNYQRTIKMTFTAQSLDQIEQFKTLLKNKAIDEATYATMVQSVPQFSLVVNGESTCSEFMKLYSRMLDGLENGGIYDIKNVELGLSAVYEQYGWENLDVSLSSIDKLDIVEVVDADA